MPRSLPVYLVTARDQAVRYLADPLNRRVLKQRLAVEGVWPAYSQAIAIACPELPSTYYIDVVDMVRSAILAEKPRMVKRARGEAA